MVQLLTHCADNEFQLSTTLLLKTGDKFPYLDGTMKAGLSISTGDPITITTYGRGSGRGPAAATPTRQQLVKPDVSLPFVFRIELDSIEINTKLIPVVQLRPSGFYTDRTYGSKRGNS